MARGEIVKFLTEDRIELQGFFVDSSSREGLLHIHGLSGNFYENSFIDFEADLAEKKKISLLSMNTRGHDYVNDLVKFGGDGKGRIINIGGALEKFEDCVHDIKAGIDFLKKKGCNRIILQGHSTGCQKISYYQFIERNKDVISLILLAPADDINIIKKTLGGSYGMAIRTAEEMIKNKKGDDFMPKGTASLPVISASRLYSNSHPNSVEACLFDYTGEMKEIASLSVPIVAIFGDRDVYLTMPAVKTLEILKSKNPQCETHVIDGAPHNFRGYEPELMNILGVWIDRTRA
jgi:pimeloyl-ACP methyl ester carboxylesterase